jgi:hypothetical protein
MTRPIGLPAGAPAKAGFLCAAWEIWRFWQKRQPKLQPLTKIVPEPLPPQRAPESGGSSPKWSDAQAARNAAVSPQYPLSPVFRLTPQSLGQMRQAVYAGYEEGGTGTHRARKADCHAE